MSFSAKKYRNPVWKNPSTRAAGARRTASLHVKMIVQPLGSTAANVSEVLPARYRVIAQNAVARATLIRREQLLRV
jgi:hypothetical protein